MAMFARILSSYLNLNLAGVARSALEPGNGLEVWRTLM